MNHAQGTTAADAETDETTRRRRRKAPIAAFLSFLFPGAGQLYNHQPRLAAAFAVPIALVLAAVAFVLVVLQESLISRLLDTRVITGLLAVNLLVLVWRLVAIVQAHRRRARLRPGRVGTRVTVALIVLAAAMHALPGAYGLKLLETLSAVSLNGNQGSAGGVRDSFPGFSGPSGEPMAAPSAQPNIESGERVNMLLVGIDSGAGRDHALTDTMLVMSIDPQEGTVMLSIPRDLVNAPLPNGEPYPGKLNSLLQTASADVAGYPFGGGVATLKATISELLGVPIHYFAAVDMAGFQQLIDGLGGVDVSVNSPVADPTLSLYLETGRTYMDGELALRYVRSRYGPGDDDFVRAARQQELLSAVRDGLARTNLLTALSTLLDAVQSTIATDVPSGKIPQLAEAIQNADMGSLQRIVLQPPDYVTPATGTGGAYVLLPNLVLIRELGQDLMGD